MSAFPWDEQPRLASAVEALIDWTTAATALNVRVPSLTVELLDDTGDTVVGSVVFDLLENATETEPPKYGYRTL